MQKKYLAYSSGIFLILTLVTVGVILFARGFRYDKDTGTIKGTGIISVSSTPDGGLVYLDQQPRGASNTSIVNLNPSTYSVEIDKEGYHLWQKDIIVEQEVVTKIDALLIPKFPTLRPLTFTDVVMAVIAPDGQRIAFTVTEGSSAGVWVFDLEEGPFNRNREPYRIVKDTLTESFSSSEISWSPTSDQLLMTLEKDYQPIHYLYDFGTRKTELVTAPEDLIHDWLELGDSISEQQLALLPEDLLERIKDQEERTEFVSISPNGKYVLYKSFQDESKNEVDYYVREMVPNLTLSQPLEPATPWPLTDGQIQPILTMAGELSYNHSIQWFPDSEHLIIKSHMGSQSTRIEIVERTGTNRTHVFTGDIRQVHPDLNGTKILVLTKFDPSSENYNLYSINLR